MGLSGKTGLVLGAGVLALLAVVASLSLTLVMDGFRDLERLHGERNAARLREAIHEAHANLDLKNADWAGWDDTYRFMGDQYQEYADSNLQRESVELLGIDMMAFVHADGRLMLSRGVDPATGEFGDGSPVIRAAIESDPLLRTPPPVGEGRHGVMVMDGRPVLVSVRPVLTSQQEGPARGSLVLVRAIDEEFRLRLEELMQGEVGFAPPGEAEVGGHAHEEVRRGSVRLLVGEDHLHALTPVADLSGLPVLVASLTMPREIGARGWAVVRFSLVVVMATGLALWLVTDRLVRVLVLSRVGRLSEELSAIEASDGAALRVTERGRDELGDLSRTVNRMLAALDARAAELRDARAAAEAAARAKGEFVAAVSHEVRSPLSAVVGSVDLLRGGGLGTEERREHLDAIARNARHMLVVVGDLLDHSKIEAGRMTLESIEYGPRQVVREAAAMVAELARAKGLDLRVDLGARLADTVVGDPTRVRQIVLNLLGNAVKFTPAGRVTVRASMGPSSGGVGVMRIEVEDTGIGLSEAQAAGLFQSYVQADAATTRKYGGTGLGLSISRALARQMGGDVTVRSRLGEGSVFTLELPVGPLGTVRMSGDDDASRPGAGGDAPLSIGGSGVRGTGAQGSPLAGVRVLVGDDSEDNRRLLVHHLRRAGAVVTEAEDGRQAVAAFEGEAGGFDVVVLDLQMPVMDGWEAASRLRDRAALLAASASTTETPERLVAAGFAGHVVKPVDPGELVAQVARLAGVEKRRAA